MPCYRNLKLRPELQNIFSLGRNSKCKAKQLSKGILIVDKPRKFEEGASSCMSMFVALAGITRISLYPET